VSEPTAHGHLRRPDDAASTPDGRVHDGHAHAQASHDHDHDHDHDHPTGFVGFLHDLFVPHTHDTADSVDDALEASREGVRALKVSLFVLLGTTVLQFVLVLVTGSVALLADTVHNFSDALTAVPLWVAFILGRRPASRRYTYGYGRAEDLAGLFIVVVVLLSAVVAAWQSIDRLIHPHAPDNLGWLAVAGMVGFLGNESVAIYRIRVGRRIGSAALVADGVHARTDGFTSLAVVLGALGVWLGFPLADPIIGILIAIAICGLLIGTVRNIGRRLMDGIEPDLLATAEHALLHTPHVLGVRDLRLRWVGHRLQGDATVVVGELPLAAAEEIAREATAAVRQRLHSVDAMTIRPAAH
jgi:cation diffusion facilitator family transporter